MTHTDVKLAELVRKAQHARTAMQQQWLSFWEELAHYFYQNRKDFISQNVAGDERFDDVWLSEPEIARRTLGAALGSLLRPPGVRWIKARARKHALNVIPAVRIWLDNVARITYDAIYDPRARFEERAAECDQDIVTFGTADIQVTVDEQAGHFVFQTHSIKDVLPFENALGVVDTVKFFVEWRLDKIIEVFGKEQLTPDLRAEVEKGINADFDKTFELLNVIAPTEKLERFGLGSQGGFPVTSLWIAVKEKKLISKKGMRINPHNIIKWESVTNEPYGRSPCMVALPGARLANTIAASIIELTEKRGNPPLTAPADVIRGEVESFSGGLTLYDGAGFQFQGSPIKPIDLGADPETAAELLRAQLREVGRALFLDILAPNPEGDSDFTQFDQAAQNARFQTQVQPVMARVETEYSGGIVDRVFNTLLLLKVFPPPPPEIENEQIDFIYDSPIRAATERTEALTNLQAFNAMGPLNDIAGDNIDMDKTYRKTLVGLGFDTANFKDPAVVAEERAQKQQLALAEKAAAIAKDAAPAIKAAGDAGLAADQLGLLGGQQDQGQLPPPDAGAA